MLAAAPHRGTDVSLVHRGSAVVAVCSESDAPRAWLAQQNDLVAGFAGLLDNRDELAYHLRDLGQPLDAMDPASLLLTLYRVCGDQTPGMLRGAYAAVVTDGTRLLAFRDHLGQGPLFYRDDPQGVFVASEAKQIIAGAGLTPEPDFEVLERIFYNLVDDGIPCALRGARRLPKASILRAEPHKPLAVTRYWYPERLLETARLSPDDIRTRFEQLLDRAVTRMLTGADVISLSGGIDSTAVAAFAAPAHLRLTGRPLPAITHVFPNYPTVDERRYTEMVAAYLGLPLHAYMSPAGQLDDLEHWVRLSDGPPMALLPEIAYEQRLTRELGFSSILTGEFGEFVYDMRTALITHLAAKRRYGALRRIFTTWPPQGAARKQIARDALAALVPRLLAVAYRRLARRRGNPMLPDWVDPRLGNRAFHLSKLQVPPQRLWEDAQLAAFRGPGIGTESVEFCSALNGVQIRRPLADVDFWEFFLALPAEVKYPARLSKALVRSLLRGKLPDPVLDRRDKTVFDEAVLARTDYAALRRWLVDSPYRMPGVDYGRLRQRLERQDFTLRDVVWANDLAAVHAFVSLW